MEEFACITVRSRPGEAKTDFSTRLSHLWTDVLRSAPEQFDLLYAESSEFAAVGKLFERQYLVEPAAVSFFTQRLQAVGFDHLPIDPDDTYTKFEAVPPDWWQIEH